MLKQLISLVAIALVAAASPHWHNIGDHANSGAWSDALSIRRITCASQNAYPTATPIVRECRATVHIAIATEVCGDASQQSSPMSISRRSPAGARRPSCSSKDEARRIAANIAKLPV